MADRGDISDVFELIKSYAKQETVDPLRNVGRYLARGLAGAFLIGLGIVLLLIGVLRVLQTETDVFDDGLSFIPYLIVVILGGIIAGLFVRQISKGGLDG